MTTNWAELVRARRAQTKKTFDAFDSELDEQIGRAGELIRAALKGGRRVFALGNGGSASDAEHFAAELVGRYLSDRSGLPAMAFTTNSSAMTALGNDFGYEQVFARQVEAWAGPGDVVVCLSTSGNSPNVLRAAEAAKRREARVVGMTGSGGGKLAALCDVALKVPSNETPRIQEAHIFILHTLAEISEQS